MPVIQNLLFAFDTREVLDPIIEGNRSLQYQYKRGGGRLSPMTVPDGEMERFIHAVLHAPSPVYYSPDEITPDMIGREIIVTGGPLDSYRGRLIKIQGSKKRRLIVEIKGFIAVTVEVNPDYVRFV